MSFRIYYEGEKSLAFCDKCGSVVNTTFKFKKLTYVGSETKPMLVACCDVCDVIVATPATSYANICEHILQSQNNRLCKVSVLWSARYSTVLDNIVKNIDNDQTSDFGKVVLMYFLQKVNVDAVVLEEQFVLAKTEKRNIRRDISISSKHKEILTNLSNTLGISVNVLLQRLVRTAYCNFEKKQHLTMLKNISFYHI